MDSSAGTTNCSAAAAAVPGEKPVFSADCLRGRAPLKLFVTDLDGTLLLSSLRVSERAIAAFSRLHELGVQCAIATGRPCGGAITCIGDDVLQRLGLPNGQPGIYMNGSVVFGKSGERLHLEYISPDQTQQVLGIAEQHGWLPRVCGYGETGIFCLEKDEFTMKLYEHYGEAAPEVVTRQDFQNKHFCKLAVNGSVEDVIKIRQVFQDALVGTTLRAVCPIPCSVEICPAGTSKAAGIRLLLEHLNLKQEEVFAIGDSENDIEMLEFAGVSVAVGNASSIARDAAKYVTCCCDEDAVAKAAECIAQVLEEKQSHQKIPAKEVVVVEDVQGQQGGGAAAAGEKNKKEGENVEDVLEIAAAGVAGGLEEEKTDIPNGNSVKCCSSDEETDGEESSNCCNSADTRLTSCETK